MEPRNDRSAGPDVAADPAAAAPAGKRRRSPLLATAAVAVSLGLLAVILTARQRSREESQDLTSETSVSRPAPAALLAAAPAASRAAGTARIRTNMRTVDAGQPIHSRTQGVVALDTSAFDLTYHVEVPELAGPATPSELDSRAFSDGTTVWVTIPSDDLLAGVPLPSEVKRAWRGKKYLSFSLEDGGDEEALIGPGIAAEQGLGFSIGKKPGDVLGYLSSVGKVVQEGGEQIDGEDVDRYVVELDLDSLQRALPSEERSFDAYDFKPDVPHTFPARVWLDRAGRLRKLTYRLDLAGLLTEVALRDDYFVEECPEPDTQLQRRLIAGDPKALDALDALEEQCTKRPARPEELVIEGSVELSDYGTPLTVSAPPAGEILTDEALGSLFGDEADGSGGPAPARSPATTARPRSASPKTTTAAKAAPTTVRRPTSTTR